MPSTFRQRFRDPIGKQGSGVRSFVGTGGSNTTTIDDVMINDYVEDYTSSHMGPFRCARTGASGSIINGSFPAWDGIVTYSNVPSGVRNNSFNYKLDITPDDGYLKTATLAKTNPNLSTMSVPNSLFELRELPSLIKQYGQEALNVISKNVSLKSLANLNLMASFGVAPMVQDLQTLSKFQANVEKRLRTIQDVRLYGGVRKTKKLGVYEDVTVSPSYFWDGPVFIPFDITQKTSVEVSGCTIWRLSPYYTGNLYSDHSQDRSLFDNSLKGLVGLTGRSVSTDQLNAFRAAYGLYSYGINDLWNILPFSWLVDYFSNVGDVVDANSNQLGLEPTAAVLMKKSTVTVTHPLVQQGDLTISAGTMTGVLKTRMPIDIPSARSSITYKVPAITGSQWAILGSLFLSRIPSVGKTGTSLNPYLSWAHKVLAGIR